jgi:hypothetical protein
VYSGLGYQLGAPPEDPEGRGAKLLSGLGFQVPGSGFRVSVVGCIGVDELVIRVHGWTSCERHQRTPRDGELISSGMKWLSRGSDFEVRVSGVFGFRLPAVSATRGPRGRESGIRPGEVPFVVKQSS